MIWASAVRYKLAPRRAKSQYFTILGFLLSQLPQFYCSYKILRTGQQAAALAVNINPR